MPTTTLELFILACSLMGQPITNQELKELKETVDQELPF